MTEDSVQFLSNIKRTEWFSGKDDQPVVNTMLTKGWALLAAGVNPYGEPTWLLGKSNLDPIDNRIEENFGKPIEKGRS